jgi:ribosomal protein S18 acetylase RimI-like enzyme
MMQDCVTQDISVRAATAADAGFVLGLVPQLAAFGPPPWRTEQQMVETDTLVISRALQGLSPGATILIAEDAGGKPLGFVHVCGDADYYTRRECGHIADLVVAPEARGRSVGEKLIAASEEWARAQGYSLLTLNVFLENTHARSLYERTGFGAEIVRYVKELR